MKACICMLGIVLYTDHASSGINVSLAARYLSTNECMTLSTLSTRLSLTSCLFLPSISSGYLYLSLCNVRSKVKWDSLRL